MYNIDFNNNNITDNSEINNSTDITDNSEINNNNISDNSDNSELNNFFNIIDDDKQEFIKPDFDNSEEIEEQQEREEIFFKKDKVTYKFIASLIILVCDAIIRKLFVTLLKKNEDKLQLTLEEKKILEESWTNYLLYKDVKMTPEGALISTIIGVYASKLIN